MNNKEIINLIKGTEYATFTLPGLGETVIPTIELKPMVELWEHQLTNGWIPVSERLPIHEEYLKDDGRFIATDGNRRYQAWFNIYDGCFAMPNRDDIMREDKCVIAWQPLPEKYKEESE